MLPVAVPWPHAGPATSRGSVRLDGVPPASLPSRYGAAGATRHARSVAGRPRCREVRRGHAGSAAEPTAARGAVGRAPEVLAIGRPTCKAARLAGHAAGARAPVLPPQLLLLPLPLGPLKVPPSPCWGCRQGVPLPLPSVSCQLAMRCLAGACGALHVGCCGALVGGATALRSSDVPCWQWRLD